jgi:hypothetical protein
MDSWFFLSFFPAELFSWNSGSGRDEEPSGKRNPAPDSDPFSDVEFERISHPRQAQSPLRPDAMIRVYDDAGNVIETHEHKGDFKEP